MIDRGQPINAFIGDIPIPSLAQNRVAGELE